MSATVACTLLVAAAVGFGLALLAVEKVVVWLAAGRRPKGDVLADAGGHAKKVQP